MARHGLFLAAARLAAGGIPLAVLAINVLGCVAAGWLAATLAVRQGGGEGLRLFALVGFLGAFTTFSAFGVENLELARQAGIGRAVLHAVLHVVLSLGAVALGALLAR